MSQDDFLKTGWNGMDRMFGVRPGGLGADLGTEMRWPRPVFYCRELGCPGHPRSVDMCIPVLTYCGALGCKGHRFGSEKCLQKPWRCGDPLCPGHVILGERCVGPYGCGVPLCPGHKFAWQSCRYGI